MRPPPYHVGDDVECVAPNDAAATAPGHERFVIIGAGKTGIDVCLWLLRNGIAAERLTWMMPRDAWLMDRANIQPGVQFADRFKADFAARLDRDRPRPPPSTTCSTAGGQRRSAAT